MSNQQQGSRLIWLCGVVAHGTGTRSSLCRLRDRHRCNGSGLFSFEEFCFVARGSLCGRPKSFRSPFGNLRRATLKALESARRATLRGPWRLRRACMGTDSAITITNIGTASGFKSHNPYRNHGCQSHVQPHCEAIPDENLAACWTLTCSNGGGQPPLRGGISW